jgi:transglutaminase-like putative cysteine protease
MAMSDLQTQDRAETRDVASLTVNLGCRFHFAFQEPTSAVVLVELRSSAFALTTDASWNPEPVERYLDRYGNVCRRLFFAAEHGSFEYRGTVMTPDRHEVMPDESHRQAPIDELPASLLHWLLPSRYCESDLLGGDARELFGDTPPNALRVQAVCDWIHSTIEYGVPSTPTTTTSEVLARSGGMCRDLAHAGVTFCRALGIPARYVSGYLPDIDVAGPQPPQDFHAWFEVFLGGRWWTFDARFNTPRVGRIPIGRGRDASDVAMVTTFGAAQLEQMHVWADVE